jgi:hypothetical protein
MTVQRFQYSCAIETRGIDKHVWHAIAGCKPLIACHGPIYTCCMGMLIWQR